MKNASLSTLLLLTGTLLACRTGAQVPATSTNKPKVTTATDYQWKEADPAQVHPCLSDCFPFEADKTYRSGTISWSACLSGSTAKKYLNLKLVKDRVAIKVRLLCDCDDPGRIQALRCGTDGTDADVNFVVFSQSAAVSVGSYGTLLTVRMVAQGQVEVDLKSGWRLYYDSLTCND